MASRCEWQRTSKSTSGFGRKIPLLYGRLICHTWVRFVICTVIKKREASARPRKSRQQSVVPGISSDSFKAGLAGYVRLVDRQDAPLVLFAPSPCLPSPFFPVFGASHAVAGSFRNLHSSQETGMRKRVWRNNLQGRKVQGAYRTAFEKSATCRAGPVSSRICIPVLARSTA